MRKRYLYAPDWHSVIRPRILVRDGFKCTICQAPQATRGYYEGVKFIEILDDFMMAWAGLHGKKVTKVFLQVMHKDQNPANNNPDNLAAVCPTCHMRHDNQFKRVKWLMRKPN